MKYGDCRPGDRIRFKGLVDLNRKNQALLSKANERIRELLDHLALFKAELLALRNIKLPSSE
jgi:hypothetical protein